MSQAEDILGIDDNHLETVNVPEWKRDISIRNMSGTERDEWENSILVNGKVSHENLRAKLLVKTLCDEHGNRLFSDQQAPALGQKNAAVLDRLFDISKRVNGIGVAEINELKKT